jgi:hypothetical protein
MRYANKPYNYAAFCIALFLFLRFLRFAGSILLLFISTAGVVTVVSCEVINVSGVILL